jgi:hypothetical protein
MNLLACFCRKLKQSAEQLLAPDQWQVLYSCRMLRTSRGKAFGLLVGSYGLGWHLWPAASGAFVGVCSDPAVCRVRH